MKNYLTVNFEKAFYIYLIRQKELANRHLDGYLYISADFSLRTKTLKLRNLVHPEAKYQMLVNEKLQRMMAMPDNIKNVPGDLLNTFLTLTIQDAIAAGEERASLTYYYDGRSLSRLAPYSGVSLSEFLSMQTLGCIKVCR